MKTKKAKTQVDRKAKPQPESQAKLFESMGRSYGLSSPDQIQMRILFKLLQTIYFEVAGVTGPEAEPQFITTIKFQWELAEQEIIRRNSKA
jgi:hypothetical protein